MELNFYIKVIPGAKQEKFKLDGEQIKIYLRAPAVEGKANDALISFISNNLCIISMPSKEPLLIEKTEENDLFNAGLVQPIKKSQITITKGLKLRTKTITIMT